ncbi:MAG: phenylacetate-CoA oxygenase subunit PaaJ, partial [Flavobacteriales bacterium]|nr:phenylacetate-CoA oxygenase subunit PaaJ [Flavobacteriales bacterium]
MQSGKIKEIWKLLDSVPDPEIPVISVVELGVVRNISFTNNAYQILITPTYSGCP